MFVYEWSALGLRSGLVILSFYPMGSFALRVTTTTTTTTTTKTLLVLYITCSIKAKVSRIRDW